MTNQEINERVAKLCGWKIKTNTGLFFDSSGKPHVDLPNYAESLDACREFMGELHGLDRCDFVEIANLTDRAANLYDYEHMWVLITLTPPELCECFLKLKGQWDEN